ncbi:MAG: FAD-dependent oxidoreductase [Geminicoccaceae bacterium]
MSLTDARRIEAGAEIVADLCIVGGGAAGIALAREFVGGPLRIVLLESGGLEFARRPQRLYVGENVGVPNYATAHSRFRMFGGSTTRWPGQCRPLDAIDFEARDWVPFSGWPFGRAHLEPWYRRAQTVCHLGTDDFEPAAWLDGAPALPLDGDDLEPIVFQFGHPTDFGQAYRSELETAANVEVLLNANAVEIEPEADCREVRAVAVRTFAGRAFRVRAAAVVLAGGGIENARLLLASNRHAPAGLGNQHDLVGRFFMDHPYLTTGYLVPDPGHDRGLHVIETFKRVGWEQRAHLGYALAESVLRRERLNGCSAYFIRRFHSETAPEYFSPGGKSFAHLREVLTDKVPDKQIGRHLRNVALGYRDVGITLARRAADLVRPKRCLALRIIPEATPRRVSRVTLSDQRDELGMPRVRVDWRLNPDDRRGLDRLRAALQAVVQDRGLGTLIDDPSEDETGWPTSMMGGKHHIGTTRMHLEPKQGVVDPDCRVHGLANLYVAGSSVFPTAGYANPTLTIVALALRLADHLKGRLRRPNGG